MVVVVVVFGVANMFVPLDALPRAEEMTPDVNIGFEEAGAEAELVGGSTLFLQRSFGLDAPSLSWSE